MRFLASGRRSKNAAVPVAVAQSGRLVPVSECRGFPFSATSESFRDSLQADRLSPTRAADSRVANSGVVACDAMRVCCQACQCPTVIKCSVRADARLSAPVAFVYRHAVLGATAHRFQTCGLPRTFGLNSPVNGRKVRFDRFGVSAPLLVLLEWPFHVPPGGPKGKFKVQGLWMPVSSLFAIESQAQGLVNDIIINKMS